MAPRARRRRKDQAPCKARTRHLDRYERAPDSVQDTDKWIGTELPDEGLVMSLHWDAFAGEIVYLVEYSSELGYMTLEHLIEEFSSWDDPLSPPLRIAGRAACAAVETRGGR